MTRRDVVKPAFSLRKLRENTCTIASGDYSTPVSQREQQAKLAKLRAQRNMQNSYQQQHQLPRYYSAHPYYIPHHYNTSHRFGRQK